MQSSAYLLNQKGTKVVFGDDASTPDSPPRPRGMTIHPSRMGTVPGAASSASTSSSFRPPPPSYQQPAQGYQPAGGEGVEGGARPALNPNPYVPGNGTFVPTRQVRPPRAKLPPSERAPKTEAQARYAKKKRDKVKKRKQAAVRSAPKSKEDVVATGSKKLVVGEKMEVDGESSEEESSSSEEDEEVTEAVVEKKRKRKDVVELVDSPAVVDSTAPPPTKRATPPPPSATSDVEKDEEEEDASTPPPRELILPASFTSNPLPPFPTLPPSHPAPSASLLHPLTVPHALTTATIISSSHTTPLPRSSASSSKTSKPKASTKPDASSSSSSSDDSSSSDEEEEVDEPTTPPPPAQEPSNVGLSERMLTRLGDLGVEDLFAVQTGVIPFLLPGKGLGAGGLGAGGVGGGVGGAGLHPMKATRDVCVSAPTGSGKTLAYVVPVVEVLSKRIVTRLRALIILPTRDLVSQVKETFESVAKGTGLKIATVTGSQSFASEQANLVSSLGGRSGSSMVDILICTPGRLIDHLNGTPGFSLEFLRFLIIDEADRLLTQSFQDWLQVVLAKTRATTSLKVEQGLGGVLGGNGSGEAVGFEGELEQVSQCQKLLFSATLTRDPSKIAALKLHDPQYFVIQDESDTNPTEHVEGEAFAVPATLKEHFLVVPTSTKPLHLLHLLHSPKFTSISSNRNVLCFTKSVESAARLVQLVKFFEEAYVPLPGEEWKPLVVKAYSSDLGGQGGSGGERAKVLREFKEGKVDLLICSDLIARGIDIASVSHVVSYDVPVDMRKYIHRVGRTARAGREGSAWSLVETQEARHFKSLLRSSNHLEKLKKLKVEEEELDGLKPAYEVALGRLRDVFGKM